MILVLNLNQRERDELAQALQDHQRALIAHGVEGRAANTYSVYQKFCHARNEAKRRP
jgi:(p)ppGpp synthase/HD superfamily hydrolase